MTVASQLADELAAAAFAWAPLIGGDAYEALANRARAVAPAVAAQLAQDTDDRLAAQTVTDVMAVLGGREPAWYAATPLGRAVARSTGSPLGDAVSVSVAAAMLGVSRGRVYALLAEGKLDRHPDGGVSVGSVLERAARLDARP